MSHDPESQFHQKLLIIDSFPGRHSISNISKIINGARNTIVIVQRVNISVAIFTDLNLLPYQTAIIQ